MQWFNFPADWDVPFVSAEVSSPHGSRQYSFIVDSGSVYTLLPTPGAIDLLGEYPDEAKFRHVGGDAYDAQNNPLLGIPLTVDLTVGGLPPLRGTPVWIVRNLAWPLLGAREFFHNHSFVYLNWPGHGKGRRFGLQSRQ